MENKTQELSNILNNNPELTPDFVNSTEDLSADLQDVDSWSDEGLEQTASDNDFNIDQARGIRNEFEKRGELEAKVKSGQAIFERFDDAEETAELDIDVDMLLDIPVEVTVEIGRTTLEIKNILQLAQGSVIELNGVAGEPMTVLVNGRKIARGEVVVVNDKFGVRLTDVIDPRARIKRASR